jgi:dienelactone hydrolase
MLTVRTWRVALPLLLLLTACGTATAPRHGTGSPTSPPTSQSPSAPRTLPPIAQSSPPYAVAVRTLTVTEPDRYTPARGFVPGHAGRTLLTTVWYPVAGPPAGPVGSDLPALRDKFPLLVFAHGFDTDPDTYAWLLRYLARAGFVVAAPLFPVEGAGLPGPPNEGDLPNQPGDVSAVLTAMLSAAAPGDWLAGAIDPSRVAVVGHSDGGETVAGMLLIRADRDPRVRAAVILGGQLPTWGPFRPLPVPVLLEQGGLDTINPPSNSQALWAALVPPKAYLDVFSATHLGPVTGPTPNGLVVAAVIVDFLRATLLRSRPAAAALLRDGDRPGVAQLTLRPADGVLW